MRKEFHAQNTDISSSRKNLRIVSSNRYETRRRKPRSLEGSNNDSEKPRLQSASDENAAIFEGLTSAPRSCHLLGRRAKGWRVGKEEEGNGRRGEEQTIPWMRVLNLFTGISVEGTLCPAPQIRTMRVSFDHPPRPRNTLHKDETFLRGNSAGRSFEKKKTLHEFLLNCCYFDLGNVFVSRLGSFRLFFFNPLRALWEQQLKGKEILRLETGVEIARLKILSCFSESRKIIVFLWWWLSSKAMLFNVCLENFGRRNLLLYLYFETVRGEIESRSKIRSSLPYYLFL